MKAVALAGALVAIAWASAARAADCHAMIDQYNAYNATSAELQRNVAELDSCDPKWLAVQDQRAAIGAKQIALRVRLEQSCKSILTGGNSLADLRKMSSAFEESLALVKATCGFEEQLGDDPDDDELD